MAVLLGYASFLRFDGPQYVLNHVLATKLPAQQRSHIGKLHGLFPFTFRTESIRIGEYVELRNVKVSCVTLKACIYVESAVVLERPSEGANLQPEGADLQPEGANLRPEGANLQPKGIDLLGIVDSLTKAHVLQYVRVLTIKNLQYASHTCGIDWRKKTLTLTDNALGAVLRVNVTSLNAKSFNQQSFNTQSLDAQFLDAQSLVTSNSPAPETLTSSAVLSPANISPASTAPFICTCTYSLQLHARHYCGKVALSEQDLTLTVFTSPASERKWAAYVRAKHASVWPKLQSFLEGDAPCDLAKDAGHALSGEDLAKDAGHALSGYVVVPYKNDCMVGHITFDSQIDIRLLRSMSALEQLKDYDQVQKTLEEQSNSLGIIVIRKDERLAHDSDKSSEPNKTSSQRDSHNLNKVHDSNEPSNSNKPSNKDDASWLSRICASIPSVSFDVQLGALPPPEHEHKPFNRKPAFVAPSVHVAHQPVTAASWLASSFPTIHCHGTYGKCKLQINMLDGRISQHAVSSSSICVDFEKKCVEPIRIKVDSFEFETCRFNFAKIGQSLQNTLLNTQNNTQTHAQTNTQTNAQTNAQTNVQANAQTNAQNDTPTNVQANVQADAKHNAPSNALDWKMCPIPIYSSNKKMYFGDFALNGTIAGTSCKINFALAPSLKVPKTVQRFNIETRGVVTVSPKSINIESLHIKSAANTTTEASLELCANKFSDLFAALCKVAKREPILRDSVQMKGRIRGTFALEPIVVFLSIGDAISGKASFNLDIAGTLAEPRLSGTFTLRNGYYEHFNNGVVLKNVTLDAHGEGETLKISSVRLDDGTLLGARPEYNPTTPAKRCAGGWGALTLLRESRVYDPQLLLNLRCNFLQVAYGKTVKARASGDLKMCGPLTGASDAPMVTGDVAIDDMTISVSEDAPSADAENWAVFDKNVEIFKQRSSRTDCPCKKGRFGLDIKLGGNVVVKTNGLNCFLTGNLIAKGPIVSPYLIGEMTANPKLSSQYNLFGKIMSVKTGHVRYDDEYINDPSISLVLVTKVNRFDIFARLAGRLSNTNITLQSHPPLTSEEVLSLLLFGQGLTRLSSEQNSRVKGFSSHMLRGNPLRFIDKLRDKLKLDSLEVVDTQNISSGETTQALRFGKKIKKARVFIDQDISQKNDSKMTVRYDITPEIGLDATIGTHRGSSGVGVQWMKRY
ncbi:MAG: translocation/assembly module TamB domain-containing protein [Holosporales bacterium]|nr:translocation/assembly module TamB domain-containing protein [Holosporales bacterium]